jgi:DNA-binding GntR family transcriptional regulator
VAGETQRGTGLAEKAYLHLKTQLLDGRHTTGELIPVEEIAAELDTSRQPVMDALKRLCIEGFVDIVPQVGSRVRQHSKSEIQDFYRLFAMSEGLIAELAALRAKDADIVQLRLISKQINDLLAMGIEDAERGRLYRVFNRRLHSELRRIIGSRSLSEIVESMGDRSDFYIAGAPAPVFSPGLDDAHREHEQVINAIATRDPRGAHAAMEAHIHATAARLMQRLDSDREPKASSGRVAPKVVANRR